MVSGGGFVVCYGCAICVACCVWGRSSDVVMVILCYGSVGLIGHTCYVTNYDSYRAVACGPGTPLSSGPRAWKSDPIHAPQLRK